MLRKIYENNLITLGLVLFLVSSFIFLSFLGWKQAKNPERGNWWSVSFDAPRSLDSLDFTIENHSVREKFHWLISDGKEKFSEGTENIPAGETRIVRPEVKNRGGKISVTVSDGESRKEIYKIIE